MYLQAMKKLKNGQSGTKDGITSEIMKADIETSVKYLEKLFTGKKKRDLLQS